MTHFAVDAAPMLTIPPDSPLWESESRLRAMRAFEVMSGAFVRLQPPAGASGEIVAEVRDWCLKWGAVSVRVQPRAAAPKVLVAEREAAPAPTARAAVERLLVEARSVSGGWEALNDLVQRTMSEAGI